jgi:hypothetical protein
VVAHVANQRIALPGYAGLLNLRPEGTSVHSAYVWKPCCESLSPFYPFRMVTIGSLRIYVRIFDGSVFTSLTTNVGGL